MFVLVNYTLIDNAHSKLTVVASRASCSGHFTTEGASKVFRWEGAYQGLRFFIYTTKSLE